MKKINGFKENKYLPEDKSLFEIWKKLSDANNEPEETIENETVNVVENLHMVDLGESSISDTNFSLIVADSTSTPIILNSPLPLTSSTGLSYVSMRLNISTPIKTLH